MSERRKFTGYAAEIVGEIERRRNIWRIVAIVSIALNIIQWLFT